MPVCSIANYAPPNLKRITQYRSLLALRTYGWELPESDGIRRRRGRRRNLIFS
jgi:hypothetical protein